MGCDFDGFIFVWGFVEIGIFINWDFRHYFDNDNPRFLVSSQRLEVYTGDQNLTAGSVGSFDIADKQFAFFFIILCSTDVVIAQNDLNQLISVCVSIIISP